MSLESARLPETTRLATLGLVADCLRVLGVLPLIELRRRRTSLHAVAAVARGLGEARGARQPARRAGLKRVIGAIDRRLPDGGNCVRRALLEMALDRTAARERLFAGFRSGGGLKSGHAWLESDVDRSVYDAVITI